MTNAITEYEQLLEQEQALKAKLATKRAEVLQDVIAELKARIAKFGITAEELGFTLAVPDSARPRHGAAAGGLPARAAWR